MTAFQRSDHREILKGIFINKIRQSGSKTEGELDINARSTEHIPNPNQIVRYLLILSFLLWVYILMMAIRLLSANKRDSFVYGAKSFS